MSEVYSSTTSPNPTSSCCSPLKHLNTPRLALKACQVLFSFVAFILEELISSCTSCSSLYFFEFVSSTAFLFTLLLLILLSTSLSDSMGITCWPTLDFVYTAGISVFFFISSIVFSSDNRNTALEKTTVVFGFLASFFFLADVVLFLKINGVPFRAVGKSDASNGVPPAPAGGGEETAEEEKLTA